jgi:hypothetical protein
MLSKDTIDQIKVLTHLREMEAEIDQHVGVLTSLTGEEKGKLPRWSEGLLEEVDTLDILDPAATGI